MECTIDGITFEGTPAELADFLTARKSAETAAAPAAPIHRRAGKPVVVRFGEGNEQLCRSIAEARDYLRERGVPVSDAAIQQHLKTAGEYTLGRYTIKRAVTA